jgi:hypothetical protein
VSANGQKLIDALYSGKLKMDTGTVIRKGDDLSSKIDTSTKKPVEQEKAKLTPLVRDSSMVVSGTSGDSMAVAINLIPADAAITAAKDSNAVATKDNNVVWKQYIDEFTGTLRTEVLPSKKIKSGTYSVLIEYEIGLDGQVTVNSVSSSPESSFLDQQVKERLTLTSPQLSPLLNSYGKPRKAAKKQILTLSK